MLKKIKKIHTAEYRPVGDLITYSPLPMRSLEMIDPFIFLNHHGPQQYPQNNNGLPFGPHPHRGMQTVTFIIHGDIAHQDSSGHNSIINPGGVQWMIAGSGLIHAEISSETFKKEGGLIEILQLWINLPAKLKMTQPTYKGLEKADIPQIFEDEKKVRINLISGEWNGKTAAFSPPTNIFLSSMEFDAGGKLNLKISENQNIFFYVVKGSLLVNNEKVKVLNLLEFQNQGEQIDIEALEDSLILFGHAEAFNEPVVARGPFVMNSLQEIDEAYEDFQNGKMGTW